MSAVPTESEAPECSPTRARALMGLAFALLYLPGLLLLFASSDGEGSSADLGLHAAWVLPGFWPAALIGRVTPWLFWSVGGLATLVLGFLGTGSLLDRDRRRQLWIGMLILTSISVLNAWSVMALFEAR